MKFTSAFGPYIIFHQNPSLSLWHLTHTDDLQSQIILKKNLLKIIFFKKILILEYRSKKIYFLLMRSRLMENIFMVKGSESRSVVSDSLLPHRLCSLWNSLGWNSGVNNLSLLQRIFPTKGSRPGLPHCRWILYQLNHKGSPRILGWVAYSFSSGASQPSN